MTKITEPATIFFPGIVVPEFVISVVDKDSLPFHTRG